MSWLDRLKALPPEDCGLPAHRQNRQNPRSVSFDSAQVAQSLASEGGGRAEPEQAEDAREAFEERAAIMEFDGGLSRQEAERAAAEGFCDKYARAREAREPPTSEAGQVSGGFVTKCAHAHAREAAINNHEISRELPRPEAGSRPRLASELFPPRRWSFGEWGDLRPCLLCRNLTRSGRCMAAWRGELRAARDWGPTFPGQPQRCIGYDPKADDPDQRPGRERWPEMIAGQARVNVT
jgi:hypothetical protein